MPTLYLLPCPIAENAMHTLPPYVLEIARRLEVFIVERAKTARHFIKACGPEKPLQELIFAEIGKHNAGEAPAVFREAIRAGKDVGLLSEAGCPGVADPGAEIVALAHREGVRVVPMVGPSSLLLALMASGMNGQQFAFHGYLSPKRPEAGPRPAPPGKSGAPAAPNPAIHRNALPQPDGAGGGVGNTKPRNRFCHSARPDRRGGVYPCFAGARLEKSPNP